MRIERLNPVSKPTAPYSHVSRISSHSELYFMSGQIDATPMSAGVPRSMYEQASSVFESIERILQLNGLGPENVVRFLTFLVAGSDPTGFYEVREEYYARWYPDGEFPGHSLVYVEALAGKEFSIEIEGWFAR